MTDITELALLVSKAKASVFTLEYISQFEPADIDSDDVDLRFEVDGRDTGTNVSIVDECGQAARVIGVLVEALEKAQQTEKTLKSRSRRLDGIISAAEQRIAELESFRTAYMEWSDKTDWVQTDKRFYVVKPLGKHRADVLKAYIEHLESRTVKLSKRSVGEVMHMSGFSRDYAEGWCSGNDNGIHEIRAAGIKVIEGEQKNG